MVGVLVIALGIAVVTAATPEIPRWLPWLLPLAFAVFFAFQFHPGDLESQPYLVAFVGTVAVVVLVAGILVGHAIRARNDRSR